MYIYIYIYINFLKKGMHPSNQRMQSKANSKQKDKSKGNSDNKLFLEDILKLTGFWDASLPYFGNQSICVTTMYHALLS